MAKIVIYTDECSARAVEEFHLKYCLGGTLKWLDDSTVCNIVITETELYDEG